MIPLELFLYSQVRQFDQTHILTIIICLLFLIIIPFFGRKLSKEHQRIAVIGIIVFSILQEVVDYSNRIIMRDLNWAEDLPFHICNYVFYIGMVDSLALHIKITINFLHFSLSIYLIFPK